MQRILICDDEADLTALVEFNLRGAGFEVEITGTGEAALKLARASRPELILLDVMLPDISGPEVCRRLRSDASTAEVPVMMLTARREEADRVDGFEAGADDYVTKPFSVRELVLRIKALLRRQPKSPTRLEAGALRLDLEAHKAFVGDQEVALTALEFRLAHYLVARRGRVATREALLADVWGLAGIESRTVDTHIMRLRDKLGTARDQFETVRGVGYRLSAASRPQPDDVRWS